MKRKIFLAILLIAIILAGVFVFSRLQTNDNENSLGRILKKGTFILGLDDSFPPMGYRNETNEIVGFDIDVANEVCKKLGVDLVLQPISWNAKEQELNSYNIDCIWNGMSVTDERKEAMNLSLPYLENKMAFVVKNNSSLNSLEDLKEKKVGVQSGSSAQQILEKTNIYNNLKEVITYSDNITALMDLEINQIDTVLMDDVVANYYISSNNKDYRLLNETLSEEEYSIGFRKQDVELCNKVNEILIEMKKDGTLKLISEKWFGKDITVIENN